MLQYIVWSQKHATISRILLYNCSTHWHHCCTFFSFLAISKWLPFAIRFEFVQYGRSMALSGDLALTKLKANLLIVKQLSKIKPSFKLVQTCSNVKQPFKDFCTNVKGNSNKILHYYAKHIKEIYMVILLYTYFWPKILLALVTIRGNL